MNTHERDLNELLDSAALPAEPDPDRARLVRARTLALAARPRSHARALRWSLGSVAAVLALAAIGVGGTQAGRDFLRRLLVPIEVEHPVQWQAPDGSAWSQVTTGRETPYSAEEQQAVADEFTEMHALQEAGQGRLVALLEGPGWTDDTLMHTTYMVEYTLESGEKRQIGMGEPTGEQAKNLRIAEINRLRDAGAGEIVESRPSPLGLGTYVIRFALSDGTAVDIKTMYPPSTRAEREAICRELRELKAQLRFEVLDAVANASDPASQVWGTLRYTLADGRTVGTTEPIPAEVISSDGRFVTLPAEQEPVEIQREP